MMTVTVRSRIGHSCRYLITGTFLLGILGWSGLALAQMSVTPLVIETEARRGQGQGVINVTNITDAVLRARVYAEPFTYTDNGIQFLVPGQSPGDLTPYLQFSPTELVIPAGATRRIRLISRFPPSLVEGEYRAIIFAETLRNPSPTPTVSENNSPSVNVNVRIGTTFYVRQGDVSPKLNVVEATWNTSQKQIQILIENSGAASERPKIDWQLKRGETEIARGTVPESGVIAQSQRHLSLQYPQAEQTLPAGTYQLSGELVWQEADRTQKLPFNTNVTVPPVTP